MGSREYVCTACGARYETHDPPCRECANEEFAVVADSDRAPERIENVASVTYRCADCGTDHPRNSPPCSNCGGMQLRAIDEADVDDSGDMESVDEVPEPPTRRVTAVTVLSYLIGGGFVLVGLLYVWSYPVAGIVLSFAGGVAFPPTRRTVRERFGVDFSAGATVLIMSILLAVALALLIQ